MPYVMIKSGELSFTVTGTFTFLSLLFCVHVHVRVYVHVCGQACLCILISVEARACLLPLKLLVLHLNTGFLVSQQVLGITCLTGLTGQRASGILMFPPPQHQYDKHMAPHPAFLHGCERSNSSLHVRKFLDGNFSSAPVVNYSQSIVL